MRKLLSEQMGTVSLEIICATLALFALGFLLMRTRARRAGSCRPGRYLRVRGEERGRPPSACSTTEIPPRARRRDHRRHRTPARVGNTSACAEKRGRGGGRHGLPRKYLRVRGEELVRAKERAQTVEIPPRARRRDDRLVPGGFQNGNTSACAEKSARGDLRQVDDAKYLRVRGEES